MEKKDECVKLVIWKIKKSSLKNAEYWTHHVTESHGMIENTQVVWHPSGCVINCIDCNLERCNANKIDTKVYGRICIHLENYSTECRRSSHKRRESQGLLTLYEISLPADDFAPAASLT